MKFENVDLRRAGKRWDASLGVFLGLLALLALVGWRGFSAIGEFLTVVQKQAKKPPLSSSPNQRPDYRGGSKVTVAFEATEDDATNALLYLNTSLPQFRRQQKILRGMAWLLIGFGILFCLLLLVKATFLTGLLAAYLVGCGVAILLNQKNGVRKLIKQMVRSGAAKTLLGPQQYTVTPEGLGTRSDLGHGVLYWSGIERVVELEGAFALHFSAAQSILIPKRAFASPHHGAEFLRLVESYRQASTGSPIPETTKGAWWTQSGVTEAENVQKARRS